MKTKCSDGPQMFFFFFAEHQCGVENVEVTMIEKGNRMYYSIVLQSCAAYHTAQCSTVQCSSVVLRTTQCSTVLRIGAVPHSTMQCSNVQCITVLYHRAVLCSKALQCKPVQYCALQCSSAAQCASKSMLLLGRHVKELYVEVAYLLHKSMCVSREGEGWGRRRLFNPVS